MILCPFCHYQNEDGALFCEQCKSDLSGVPEVPAAQPAPVMAEPIAAMPILEAAPLHDTHPPQPYGLAPEPVEAMPVEAVPVEAMPVEAVPVEAEPVHATPVEPPPPPPAAEAPPPPP